MQNNNCKPISILTTWITICLIWTWPHIACAQRNFSVQDLTDENDIDPEVKAMNNEGQVAFSSQTASGFRAAFLWTKGKRTDLGRLARYPDCRWIFVCGINNKGQAVGY